MKLFFSMGFMVFMVFITIKPLYLGSSATIFDGEARQKMTSTWPPDVSLGARGRAKFLNLPGFSSILESQKMTFLVQIDFLISSFLQLFPCISGLFFC